MPFTVGGNHRDPRGGVSHVRYDDSPDAHVHAERSGLCDVVLGVPALRSGERDLGEPQGGTARLEELTGAVIPANYRGRFFDHRAAAALFASARRSAIVSFDMRDLPPILPPSAAPTRAQHRVPSVERAAATAATMKDESKEGKDDPVLYVGVYL